ncbi:hypothetical protein R6Z07_001122 [Ovis aries]
MECSPAIFLTPQPPHSHGLPSAFPARLQARPHLPTNIPLELGLSLTRPALACPALAFTSAGLRLARQPQPYPHAHPYLPQIRPSLSHVPGTASPPRPCFCRRPAPVACRSFGQVPESPTPPLPAGRPCRRPDRAPRGLPPSSLLAAAPSARDRPARVPDPRGAPTSHGPKHLPPILSPMHSDAHSPGRGLEETSFGDGKHTSGHRGSVPTGDSPLCHRTRVCRPRRTTLKTLRAPPASRTHAKSRRPAGWLPAPTSLCPERPCRESAGTQQKVGPLRWPGIEPGSTAWKAATLTTIPPTLHSPGGRQTPAPGSPQHTLAAASASLPRRPVSRRLCAAAAGAPSSHAAPQARQRHAVAGNPPAPPPQGGAPAALRPSGPSLPAAARQRLPALTPGGQRGARSFQHPAGQSPTPPGAGRGHFPRRQGDTGPTCLHAAGPSRAHEPTQAATGGRRVGGRPAGRQIRLWSGKAVGSPRRPSLRRGDRAPADDKGLRLERCTGRGGRRELGRAPPSAAPWRLAQRRREETKGPWGPGGRTESDRGHQKGCVASPSGNRTPVSRVTGGDTHHYTNEDGGDRPAARPPSGSRAACPRLPLPSTGRRPPRVPTQPRTKPTASVTAAARHPDRDPDPRGAGPSPARRLLPPTRAFRREKGAREGKRGCDDTPRRAPPPAAPKHAAPRRVASPPPFAGAPTSARGTAYSPSQPCFHGRPRQLSRQAGTPSSAPAPPARLRSPATARRPSPRLARQGAAACPRPLSAVRSWPGRNLPAARPGRVPSSLPAGQRTPAFLARVRPGKGAPLGRERKPCVPVQPTPRRPARAPDLGATAPVPVGSRCPGRSQARPGALPASQPAVPEPGAALPKGPCSPPPPRQSRTPGARSARAQEPGSHAFGSLGLSAVLRMGWGVGGAVAEALGGVALPRSRFPHRPSLASVPPPALARPTPARPESQPARGTLGRDPAVAERNDGARPQRPRSACT